jgi:hypothetical protein
MPKIEEVNEHVEMSSLERLSKGQSGSLHTIGQTSHLRMRENSGTPSKNKSPRNRPSKSQRFSRGGSPLPYQKTPERDSEISPIESDGNFDFPNGAMQILRRTTLKSNKFLHD